MLLRFIVKNFLSFLKETQFDMFPNPKRNTFTEHVYQGTGGGVLKGAAIYGNNGAGKSNMIHGLRALRMFACKEVATFDKAWGKNWYLHNRFRLPASSVDAIEFVAEFSFNEKAYIYQLEIDADGIKTEALYHSFLGNQPIEKIYERSYNKVELADGVNDSIRKIFERNLTDKPYATVLSLNGHLHLVENEDLDSAYEWFSQKLKFVDFNRIETNDIIALLDQNEQLLQFSNLVLSKMDIGIQTMNIRKREFEQWLQEDGAADKEFLENVLSNDTKQNVTRTVNGQPSLTISESNGKKLVTDLLFQQMGQNNYVGGMELDVQSSGTIKLLILLRYLFTAIYSDNTIIIDEISDGLHPILLKAVLEVYFKCQTKGQLIYTAHDVDLLDQQNLMRTDEMWIVKKQDGISAMYSLNEYKIHNTLSVRRGYMEGRFGGIPEIDIEPILNALDKRDK